MKKAQLLVIFLFLLALSSCSLLAPMQPNTDTLQNNMGPLSKLENSSSSFLNSTKQNENDKLEIDFFGLGIATIKADSFTLEESWEAAGITENSLSNAKKYYDNGKILVVNFVFENISINTDESGTNDHYINNFHLATKQQLDNPSQPSPMVEPIYYEQSFISGNSYFQFNVPAKGQAADVTLGFQLSKSDLEILQKNELFIVYTTMGLEDAGILPIVFEG